MRYLFLNYVYHNLKIGRYVHILVLVATEMFHCAYYILHCGNKSLYQVAHISFIYKHGLLSVVEIDSLLCKTLHYSYATLFKNIGLMYSLINVHSYFRDIR